jgi:hypothetical protein
VDDDTLKIANKTEALARGLKEGAYGGCWSANLMRVKGAKKCDKTAYFAPGIRSRCVEIPWDSLPLK